MEGKYREVIMRPALGGFIICYDEYGQKSRDEFEGMAFLGKREIVVEDPEEAIGKLMEIYSMTVTEEVIHNGEDTALGGA